MGYIDGMLSQEHHDIPKTARIPQKLLFPAIKEATRRGIGKPSVFLRMVVLERIRQGDIESLVDLAAGRIELRGSATERVNIRFSKDSFQEVTIAADAVSGGNISALVVAILLERYAAASSRPNS